MRLLIVSPYRVYPIQNGFASRLYNIIYELSKSFCLHLLYVDNINRFNGISSTDFLPSVTKLRVKTSCRWAQVFSPKLLYNGIKLLQNKKVDIIYAESIWAGLHAIILSRISGIPYYFANQNVEYIRWKRMGKRFSSILKIYEYICCKYAKKVICVSDIDMNLIHENLSVELDKLIVVPNGVNPKIFRREPNSINQIRQNLNLNRETKLICFFGSLNYLPNQQAVNIIKNILLEKIRREIDDVKILIVGSNPPAGSGNDSIIYAGYVTKIEDYINASDVVIAPLISGGGTKLKIIEALACGKVVITTSIGAEGLNPEETNNLLRVLDSWDTFVEATIEALKDPREFEMPLEFINKFTWEHIASKLMHEISNERENT